jgi:cytochrome c oxidase subunit IV
MWNIIRWCCSFVLLINSLLFILSAVTYIRDMKAHPEAYKNVYGHLNNKQIIAIFAIAGIACLVLMFVAIPL